MNLKEILATLENLACTVEPASPQASACPVVPFVVYWETTKLTLQLRMHPDAIRERAKGLAKTARIVARYPRPAAAPSMRQSKFSKQRAEQFLTDGEPENHAAYCALYGKPTS